MATPEDRLTRKILDVVRDYSERSERLSRSAQEQLLRDSLSAEIKFNILDGLAEGRFPDRFDIPTPHRDYLFDIAEAFRIIHRRGSAFFPMWRSDRDDDAVPFDWTNQIGLRRMIGLRNAFEFLDFWGSRGSEFRSIFPAPLGDAQGLFANNFASNLRFAQQYHSPFYNYVDYTVRSQGSGFRVFSTPQHVMSPLVFGQHVSTPVSGPLFPARYRFGGAKAPPIKWDFGIHEVSPANTKTIVTAF
jgi:hypothetical protein